MRIHPICKLVPSMSAEQFAALKEDIKKNGLIEPIWTVDGRIVDGRHRFKACRELKIKPEFRVYDGELDVETFVYSVNVARRQMTIKERINFVKRLLHLHPDKSAGVLAKIAGVESSTVRKYRREAERDLPRVASRTSTEGKTYRVKESPPRAQSLISRIDFEARRAVRFLSKLHPHELTDPGEFIAQLETQLARIKALHADKKDKASA